MEEINDLELELYNGTNEFANKTINISGNGLFLSASSLENISSLSFHYCTFKGTHIEFEDINLPNFLLGFFGCKIEISLDIKNCNFKRLGFRDIKSDNSIDILAGQYSNFFFRNSNFKAKRENKLTGNISISNLIIDEKIELDYLNHSEGGFEFSNNTLSNSENKNNDKIITFEYSTFDNVEFRENKFLIESSFKEMEIIQKCGFYDCEFSKVDFSCLRLGEMNFNDCKFFKTSIFHYIYGNPLSKMNFESCLFEKYTQFNSSTISSLGIDNVEFNKIVSFQETEFDIISIDRTVFEKGALFDDIQIKNIDDCDRRTIRTIKQELQKAENKIDFSRFRVYEFNTYRKDIKKKLLDFEKNKKKIIHRHREPIQLKRDAFVLRISDFVSEYGTDWKRALKFTFWFGLLFYSLFYSFENYNHKLELSNWNNWTSLISGFIRFFLVTDFYNPLENDRIYLTNPLSWLIFILGKIVIAFGIYEMIQSFRKFKA